MEFVGFVSLSSSSLYSSTSGLNVKKKVSASASMASTWKSNVKSFVILVFSQTLVIVPSMPFTCVHVECNHPQIWGLRLLILKSMSGSFPSQICCLITFVVHLLKLILNTCFKGSLDNDICKLQFISTIGRNKHDKYVWVLFFDPIKKFFTFVYAPTINQPYKLLICL